PIWDLKVPEHIRPCLTHLIPDRAGDRIRLLNGEIVREQVTLLPWEGHRTEILDHIRSHRTGGGGKSNPGQLNSRIPQPQLLGGLGARRNASDHFKLRGLKGHRIERISAVRRIIDPGDDEVCTAPSRPRSNDGDLRLLRCTSSIRLTVATSITVADQGIPWVDNNRGAGNRERLNLHVSRSHDSLSNGGRCGEHNSHDLSRVLETPADQVRDSFHSHEDSSDVVVSRCGFDSNSCRAGSVS